MGSATTGEVMGTIGAVEVLVNVCRSWFSSGRAEGSQVAGRQIIAVCVAACVTVVVLTAPRSGLDEVEALGVDVRGWNI